MRRNFFKFIRDSDVPEEIGVIAVAIFITVALLPWLELKIGPVEFSKSSVSVPIIVSPISFFILVLLFFPIFPGKDVENLADKELMFRTEFLRRIFEREQVTVHSAMDARGALNGGGCGFSAAVPEYEGRHIEAVIIDSRKFIGYINVVNDIRRASREIPNGGKGGKELLDYSLMVRFKQFLDKLPY